MLRPRRCRSCFRDRCSQLVSACLPRAARIANIQLPIAKASAAQALAIGYSPKTMAARAGLAPTLIGLTNRRATLTLPGNGAAGRILTCIVPLRRRMPDVFDHGSNLRMVGTQDFHLRPPGPKPGALKTELRSDKMADPKGFAPSAFPQTTGCSAN